MGSSDRKTGTAGVSNDGGSHVLDSAGSGVLGAPFAVAARDTAGNTQYQQLAKRAQENHREVHWSLCSECFHRGTKIRRKKRRSSSMALTRVNRNMHSTKHITPAVVRVQYIVQHHPIIVRKQKPINPSVPQNNQKEEL